MKKFLALSAAASVILSAHGIGTAPEHHRRYNKPSCFLALIFAAWDPVTLRANCGGHLRIT